MRGGPGAIEGSGCPINGGWFPMTGIQFHFCVICLPVEVNYACAGEGRKGCG